MTFYGLINDFPNDLMISVWSVNVWVVLPFSLAKQSHSDHHYQYCQATTHWLLQACCNLTLTHTKNYLRHIFSSILIIKSKSAQLRNWKVRRPINVTILQAFTGGVGLSDGVWDTGTTVSDMVEEVAKTRDSLKMLFL